MSACEGVYAKVNRVPRGPAAVYVLIDTARSAPFQGCVGDVAIKRDRCRIRQASRRLFFIRENRRGSLSCTSVLPRRLSDWATVQSWPKGSFNLPWSSLQNCSASGITGRAPAPGQLSIRHLEMQRYGGSLQPVGAVELTLVGCQFRDLAHEHKTVSNTNILTRRRPFSSGVGMRASSVAPNACA
jgi:hypothetical protein